MFPGEVSLPSEPLISDIVLPPTGASTSQSTMGVDMMSSLSASERTQGAWEKLLTESGFKIAKWPDSQEYEVIIEAEIA